MSCATVVGCLVTLLCATGGAAAELRIIDPLTPLRDRSDLAKATPRDSMIITAPRNGLASAVVVVTKAAAEALPAVAVTDLQSGSDSLPKERITIRYASLAKQPELLSFKSLGAGSDDAVLVPYYDKLLESPPQNAEMVPVWLTVKVPSDSTPGEYRAMVSVGEASVELIVSVSEWVCPDPAQWETHVGVLSSPETLAAHYGVDLWSDQHWKLVQKQLEFVGGLGNDDLWVSVLPDNHFGQQNPWITFTRRGQQIVPDLTLLERYLDLYAVHAGRPDFLLVEVWNSNRYGRGQRGWETHTDVIVDGKPQSVPLPGVEGSEAIWPPLLDALKKRVEAKGWPAEMITLGCADDKRPSRAVSEYFAAHAPYAKWAIWTHGRGDPPPWQGVLRISGLSVSHYEHLFCPYTGGARKDGITGGWDLEVPEYSNARNLIPTYIRPAQYRQLADGMMVNIRQASAKMSRSSAGITRLCLDFWRVKVPGDPGDRVAPLLLAYEKEPWAIFYRNNTRHLIAPGPDGPVGTVRYEMLREGLQECEARIAIEKALVSGRLTGALADDARELLARRLAIRENAGKFRGGHTGDILGGEDHLWGISPAWQQSARALYSIAGQLQ